MAGAQIYDVNTFTLGAVIAAHGGVMEPRPPVSDALEAQEAALDACAGADVIIFSGGSSVGERDLIIDLVARRGEMEKISDVKRLAHGELPLAVACDMPDWLMEMLMPQLGETDLRALAGGAGLILEREDGGRRIALSVPAARPG